MDGKLKKQILDFVHDNEDLLEQGKYIEFIHKFNKSDIIRFRAPSPDEIRALMTQVIMKNFNLDLNYFMKNDPDFCSGVYFGWSMTYNLPNSVVVWPQKEVPAYAFANVYSLKEVVFPSSLQKINFFAFSHTDLTELDLSNTKCSIIGGSAFTGCPLTKVALPPTLKTIDNNAFANTDISNITIPASVKYINSWAFEECYNLREIVFEGDPKDIEWGLEVFKNTPFRRTKKYRDIFR